MNHEIPESKEIVSEAKTLDFSKFQSLTFVALGCCFFFVAFLCVEALSDKSLIMMPLGLCGLFVARRQIRVCTGFEQKFCVAAFWLLIIAFVFRDMMLMYILNKYVSIAS